MGGRAVSATYIPPVPDMTSGPRLLVRKRPQSVPRCWERETAGPWEPAGKKR